MKLEDPSTIVWHHFVTVCKEGLCCKGWICTYLALLDIELVTGPSATRVCENIIFHSTHVNQSLYIALEA